MKSKTMYLSPAKAWVEAMPVGNGSLGAMVFFGTDTERLALNHDTLWSGTPKEYGRNAKKGTRESFEKAKKLALEEKYFEAQNELEENFLDFNSEKYLPLGDLLIEFHHKKATDYKRTLDFETAVATARYQNARKSFRRECFVSFPKDALVYKVIGKNGSVSFELSFRSQLKGTLCAKDGVLVFDGECPGFSFAMCKRERQDYEYIDGKYTKGFSFRTAICVRTEGGSCSVTDSGISVSGADSACIYLVTKTNFAGASVYPELSGKEYRSLALDALRCVAEADYEAVKSEHIKDVSSLYNRVRLDLGTSFKDSMPTDDRLIDFQKTKDDLSLYTLLFDFAKYLTIAGSRKGSQAMNLQGIWNDRLFAPWRSNYTVNINTEMNYWPTLPFGLFECHEPLVNLVKAIAKTGRETAKRYYGARGFVTHHNVDIWGHTNAVYNRAQWGYWQGGSGWLSRHLFEQYEYTLDERFLKSTAYPIIREAALFYMDILTDVGTGQLAIVPGTSPENQFRDKDGNVVATAKYTSMMNCIAYETIENAIKCCDILGTDDSFRKEAAEKLSKIVPLAIGEDGRLLEWNADFPETEVTHRHVSHLYALHPADMITEKTPELMEAARKTLNVRGDDGTGWSLGWKINFYARLGDGNRALKLMERQLAFVPSDVNGIEAHVGVKSGTYTNLFDAHPPFQIDGNFGFASGVFEMLARVIRDELYLLPALPDKWRDGSIDGMRVKGGSILSMTWRDGKLVHYELSGKKPLRVFYKGRELSAE